MAMAGPTDPFNKVGGFYLPNSELTKVHCKSWSQTNFITNAIWKIHKYTQTHTHTQTDTCIKNAYPWWVSCFELLPN